MNPHCELFEVAFAASLLRVTLLIIDGIDENPDRKQHGCRNRDGDRELPDLEPFEHDDALSYDKCNMASLGCQRLASSGPVCHDLSAVEADDAPSYR
jgi:hypothetical protein